MFAHFLDFSVNQRQKNKYILLNILKYFKLFEKAYRNRHRESLAVDDKQNWTVAFMHFVRISDFLWQTQLRLHLAIRHSDGWIDDRFWPQLKTTNWDITIFVASGVFIAVAVTVESPSFQICRRFEIFVFSFFRSWPQLNILEKMTLIASAATS